jgi:hypothetical protein
MMGKPFAKHEANVIVNWILTPTPRGVSSHYGLAIYIKKHLKAKEETQIFHHAKIYLIFKKML